jgi:hypothetical protein
MRNAGLAHQEPQRDLPVVDVLANRSFGNLAPGQFLLHPRPDAVRRMSLLARRFPVAFQNRIDKLDCRVQLPADAPASSAGCAFSCSVRIVDKQEAVGHPADHFRVARHLSTIRVIMLAEGLRLAYMTIPSLNTSLSCRKRWEQRFASCSITRPEFQITAI